MLFSLVIEVDYSLGEFYSQMKIAMVKYSSIQEEDLKNLPLKSFLDVLLDDVYPFLFSELNKAEACISTLRSEFDMDVLNSTYKKILSEFDELYRKEKLVLFPFLLKLENENKKSENCTPFKNIKAHYTSIIYELHSGIDLLDHLFMQDMHETSVMVLRDILEDLKENLIAIQRVKEKHFYANYKNCTGCKAIPTV